MCTLQLLLWVGQVCISHNKIDHDTSWHTVQSLTDGDTAQCTPAQRQSGMVYHSEASGGSNEMWWEQYHTESSSTKLVYVLQTQTVSNVLQYVFKINTSEMLKAPQHKRRLITNSGRPLKTEFLWFLQMNNSTTKHDTTKLITSVHSESTAHSNDIIISYC